MQKHATDEGLDGAPQIDTHIAPVIVPFEDSDDDEEDEEIAADNDDEVSDDEQYDFEF